MVDTVTAQNEHLYRRAFALAQGHTEECVMETVTEMATLLAKICGVFGQNAKYEVMNKIEVEQFDYHLREILKTKECNCKHSKKVEDK